MQLYQQKMTKPKTDVSPLKSILYVVTMIYEKNIYKPRNHKGISEIHSKRNTQAIKVHSTITITHYQSRTGT